MSKNVAVFVDVANIFYAAKAAGVDIDYVTLLKASTAGRDFVRAYAYTGLDPENDNQRNFHQFLDRSGYKVVSKDIRKYGDGRIKANLDIELVVDMMRMAQHIDIAVVVSGDGDFAPAIRAVQQLGVRVEVVSFRGNTSSDLIDVADVFTDISHLARVEKGDRSGRRVAAEDDLSMTEVPDKETDMGPRRRRSGRRDGRDERPERTERPDRVGRPLTAEPVAASSGTGSGGTIVALPGERLSRRPASQPAGVPSDDVEAAADEAADDEYQAAIEVGAVGEDGADGADGAVVDETGEGARRRRRRRGGRGRGRGRRGEGEDGQTEGQADALAPVLDEVAFEAALEEEELLDEELAPLPQHSTFGSVWDSQIGVPSAPLTPLPAGDPDDEVYEDEPEIPEYLLAERRQQQARGRNNRGRNDCRGGRPGGGRVGGYQSAIDRERYGRSGGSTGSSYNPNRAPDRAPDRPRSSQGSQAGQGGRSQQPQRQQRAPMSEPRVSEPRRTEPERGSGSSEPWSEVPPEVQEMLRAELARRGPAGRPAPATSASGAASAEPRTAPARGGRTRRPASTAAAEPVEAPAATTPAVEPSVEAKPKATPRRRAASSTANPGVAPAATTVTETPVEAPAAREASAAKEAPAAKPAARTRRTSTAKPATDAAPAAASVEAVAPAEKPAPVKRSRAKAATTEAAPTAAAEVTPAAEVVAPKPRRRTTRTSTDVGEG